MEIIVIGIIAAALSFAIGVVIGMMASIKHFEKMSMEMAYMFDKSLEQLREARKNDRSNTSREPIG